MSTRANIIIKNESYGEQLWFYRHCDGYPSGAMPTLHTFMGWLWEGKLWDSASQASGWLILLGAQEYGTNLTGPTNEQRKCGSYEPTTGRHGDIKYLYVIDLVTQTLTCYDAHRAPYNEKRPNDVWPEDCLLFVDSKTEQWSPEKEFANAED